ncbi:restriction endonuclease [bacterium SCSIO 12741]|nr:restriction endonuclease [bacterium SCSIO 12741]
MKRILHRTLGAIETKKMGIYELAEQMRRMQSLMVPSYVTQLQEISQKLQMRDQGIVRVLSEFQKNYQPLQLNIPKFEVPNPPTSQFAEIAKRLQASIPDLSAFEYNFDDFQEEEIEEEELIQVVDNTKNLIKSIYEDHNLLQVIEPRKFEEIIAELLYSKGFEVNLTKQTKDGGYDILAIQQIGGFPIKFLVECKRYKKNIGIDIIRSFCDVIRHEQANKGIIFTTSYFSKDSQKRKSEMGTILDLQNREDIIDWIIDYHRS